MKRRISGAVLGSLVLLLAYFQPFERPGQPALSVNSVAAALPTPATESVAAIEGFTPPPSQQIGSASWYRGSHKRITANGERFDEHQLTAAHRTLPFNTRIRVTNLENARSVVLRINDRGPFIGGRMVDLTAAAARVLQMKRHGVVPVLIEILGDHAVDQQVADMR